MDRLGGDKSWLGGLWKVDCEAYMAALAHHVLKIVRRLDGAAGAIAASAGHAKDNAVADFVAPLWHFVWISWRTFNIRPALRYIHRQLHNFLKGPVGEN